MQLQDIIQRVRYEIGEPSVAGQIGTQSGTWSDLQIIGYVNDAQALLARPARLQAAPVQIPLVAGTYAYDLPTDCLEDGLRKIVWTTQDNTVYECEDVGLDRWRKLMDETSNNIPYDAAVYCQWANQIYLFPTPQSTDLNLTVYYYKYPTQLIQNTDVPLIPARFHTILVNYAIGKCQAAVEESQLQMIAMQEFERLSMQMAQERSIENRDRPARVRLRNG